MTGDAWDALMRLQDAVRAIPARPALPARPESARLVERLGAITAAKPPDERYLEALQRRVTTAWLAGRGDTITPRDMRAAPWVLWMNPSPAIRLHGLLDALVTLAARNRRCLFNLIEAWIQCFAPDEEGIPEAGLQIRRLVRASSELRMASWQRADDRFDLFDATRGPKQLSAALGGGSGDSAAVLEAAGLHHPLRATSGYLRAAQQEMLAGAAAALRDPQRAHERAEAICAFLAPEGKLRFGDTAGEVARGLLSPWLDGGREPAADLRDRVRDVLIAALGDPRLNTAGWTAAGENASKLMRRWLARVSLKVFFELVAQHADDSHWRYREAFWGACLAKDVIDDSWVALGSRVYNQARSLEALTRAGGRLQFAKLNGAAGDQSVLMMRIKDTIFVEFSHSGKLRAWAADWKNCPKLNYYEYHKQEFMTLGLPFPENINPYSKGNARGDGLRHIKSEVSYWQGSVARLLEKRARIYLTERDWMP